MGPQDTKFTIQYPGYQAPCYPASPRLRYAVRGRTVCAQFARVIPRFPQFAEVERLCSHDQMLLWGEPASANISLLLRFKAQWISVF